MPSEALFVRDPREVPFLFDQVKKVLALADGASRRVAIRENDDFGFMTIQFLYKQMQHAESVLALVPRRDACLVARTMIEGLYQLRWAYQDPEECAKRWCSFAIICDWRSMQGKIKIGIHVDEADIRSIEAELKKLGDLHRSKKQEPNSPDPYHRRWHGDVTLWKMAKAVDRELYVEPYDEFSDWEHWGVRGIGDSIVRENDHVWVETNSERIAGRSLLAAFQCLSETLEIADIHFCLNLKDNIQALGEDFRRTLDSFYMK
jgi:hypothetical protein